MSSGEDVQAHPMNQITTNSYVLIIIFASLSKIKSTTNEKEKLYSFSFFFLFCFDVMACDSMRCDAIEGSCRISNDYNRPTDKWCSCFRFFLLFPFLFVSYLCHARLRALWDFVPTIVTECCTRYTRAFHFFLLAHFCYFWWWKWRWRLMVEDENKCEIEQNTKNNWFIVYNEHFCSSAVLILAKLFSSLIFVFFSSVKSENTTTQ